MLTGEVTAPRLQWDQRSQVGSYASFPHSPLLQSFFQPVERLCFSPSKQLELKAFPYSEAGVELGRRGGGFKGLRGGPHYKLGGNFDLGCWTSSTLESCVFPVSKAAGLLGLSLTT